MSKSKDSSIHSVASNLEEESPAQLEEDLKPLTMRQRLSRKTYPGAILFNFCAFALPAIYSTLSKLWIAQLDSSYVATTDAYTYIGVVAEVLNEGLPRAAFVIIGNKTRTLEDRLRLSITLIVFQLVAGFIMSIIFLLAATQFTATFVPGDVRAASVTYVRIAAFTSLTSASDAAVSLSTRSLDRPDVPLVLNLVKTVVNILLDFMFISTFRIKGVHATVKTQAAVNLACSVIASLSGLIYFGMTAVRLAKHQGLTLTRQLRPTFRAWKTLARPGLATFLESAIRNALYLWLVAGVVAMGSDYATAWGVFNTIRWGLVMVPVQSLEAATATFVGHRWGAWGSLGGLGKKASFADIFGPPRLSSTFNLHHSGILRPAVISLLMIIVFELPLCLLFSFAATYPFALYLSGDATVATITTKMWRSIDWCYIFYACNTVLAAALLATRPNWYLVNSVIVNVLWVFPWALALQVGIHITPSSAWGYHAVIFGGSLVASLLVTLATLSLWIIRVRQGKMK